MIIDEILLDKVSARAKASPRLRMNYNFHQSLDEKCHRMLNAVEPGMRYLFIDIRRRMSRLLSCEARLE